MSGDPGCRLFVLTARASRKAVIFRRGPSRHVAVISWDLARDTFTVGQWFTGRIYERRCDLSPDGEMLVYFAAGWRRQPFTWTAISRPPFLTALALWPKSPERTVRRIHSAAGLYGRAVRRYAGPGRRSTCFAGP